jgi:acyl carrier protein
MNVENEIKHIIIDVLNLDVTPEELASNTPLLDGGLELNSLLGLNIILRVEEHFDFEIEVGDLERDVFTDIKHFADFVRRKHQKRQTNFSSME